MTEDRLALIVTGAVFTTIGAIVAILRLVALAAHTRSVGFDDWSIFLAWTSSIGFTIASYISVRWGVGLNMLDVPQDWPLQAIKAVHAIEVFYYFAIFFIKMSLLSVYIRLSASSSHNAFYRGTTVTMVLIVLQITATIILEATQCIPMQKYWDPPTPGRCIDITAFFYFTNVFTIVTDIIIIALPLPTVWRIQRPRAQRIALLGTFLAGGLSTLASCIRLYSIARYTESLEPIRDAAPINTWSFIEINLGLLCASVPALRSLFLRSKKEGSVQHHAACNNELPKISDKRSGTVLTGLTMSAHEQGGLQLDTVHHSSRDGSLYYMEAHRPHGWSHLDDEIAERRYRHEPSHGSDSARQWSDTHSPTTTKDSSRAMSFDSLEIMAARVAAESI